jgi:hypothetical protein
MGLLLLMVDKMVEPVGNFLLARFQTYPSKSLLAIFMLSPLVFAFLTDF